MVAGRSTTIGVERVPESCGLSLTIGHRAESFGGGADAAFGDSSRGAGTVIAERAAATTLSVAVSGIAAGNVGGSPGADDGDGSRRTVSAGRTPGDANRATAFEGIRPSTGSVR